MAKRQQRDEWQDTEGIAFKRIVTWPHGPFRTGDMLVEYQSDGYGDFRGVDRGYGSNDEGIIKDVPAEWRDASDVSVTEPELLKALNALWAFDAVG